MQQCCKCNIVAGILFFILFLGKYDFTSNLTISELLYTFMDFKHYRVEGFITIHEIKPCHF